MTSYDVVWAHGMFFFFSIFFSNYIASSAPSATTPPPSPDLPPSNDALGTSKRAQTMSYDIVWAHGMFFFSQFFSTYFASSAPSPMTPPPSPDPHLRTTYQEHQSKPKQHPTMLFGLMVCFQGMLFLTDITFQLTACIFGLHDAFSTPSFIFLLRKSIYHI